MHSETGTIEVSARLGRDVRRGVVAIHQFWGHEYASGKRTCREFAGVNVNLLHDNRLRDSFTGMPVYNGTPCRVEAVERDSPAASRGE